MCHINITSCGSNRFGLRGIGVWRYAVVPLEDYNKESGEADRVRKA